MYKITCCLLVILTNFTIEVFAQSKDKVQDDIYSASMIVIYGGTTYTSDITHVGIINADGTYNAKGGGGDFYIRTGMSEAEFYKPYPPGSDGKQLDYTPTSPDQIVYYKRP